MREPARRKGANLAEMTGLGMPIPQGFHCNNGGLYGLLCKQQKNQGRGNRKPDFDAVSWLEEINGKKFSDTQEPLLVSVRSGARASMPGMMDTILNLGLNDESVEGFAKKTGNARFALRFLQKIYQMFSDML